MYTSAFTFGFPAAAPLITAPPYECATTTTGPVWASIKRLVVSPSLGSELNGCCTATTLSPSCCNCRITVCHPEASANAPCTSTIVGLTADFPFTVCAKSAVGCNASGVEQPTSAASNAVFKKVAARISPPEKSVGIKSMCDDARAASAGRLCVGIGERYQRVMD